jgi:hypothetical protein
MAGVAKAASGALGPNRRWLPMLPSPFLDETFGSWWHRAANAYQTTEWDLADAILGLDKHRLPRGEIDWDTAPPPALLQALVAHSPFREDELRHLIVPAGPATLAPWQRDAYCPACLEQDRQEGALYVRRSWLDSWTIRCDSHACLLGTFSLYEYVQHKPARPSGQDVFCDLLALREPLRVNPSVTPFVVPAVRIANRCRALDGDGSAQSWLPQAMLHSIVGRDLVLLMGSSATDVLYCHLVGHPRPSNAVWHDQERRASALSAVMHPLGPIATRLEASYLAGLLWRCLFPGDAQLSSDRTAVASMLRQGMRSSARSVEGLTYRWPRHARRRWTELFG